MKIVFFGTPDFAIPSLDILFNSNHEVLAVVTAPDKQRGRGRKVSFTAVKEYAVEKGIPVLQPEIMKDETFIGQLNELNADLFVVVAFRILPGEIYKMPPKGSFNLHGSLLPKYRGAAPIQWAIINGDKETGVTTFFLKDKVDTGNIIDAEKINIGENENLGSVYEKLSSLGAQLVLKSVNKIEKNKIVEKEQDESLACPAPKINKETCKIDWTKSAREIHNQIRGLSPYPAAFFVHNDKIYKIYSSRLTELSNLKSGEIKQTKSEIFIGCADKAIEILEIQPEGRKRMTTDAFLRGYTL